MTPKTHLVTLATAILLALVIAQPALAGSNDVHASLTLPVNLNYSPSTVTVNTPTTGTYSISGGTAPFTITVTGAPPGCTPQTNPFTTSNASDSFTCTPTGTGNFNIHVSVTDSAGNTGSASAYLTVNANSGGSGSGSGNNTGGFNLTGLGDLFGILMIVGIVFLACTIAIAAAAVALAVMVPRRLKQIRKALQGEPMQKPKAEEPTSEAPAADPPK